MSIFVWIALGIATGWLAYKMAGGRDGGLLLDVVVGATGALVGGAAFHFILDSRPTGFDPLSVVAALAGAAFAMLTHHEIDRLRRVLAGRDLERGAMRGRITLVRDSKRPPAHESLTIVKIPRMEPPRFVRGG